MEEMKIKNPWLGLEAYKEGEVLYGRDDDIRDLSQSVLNDTDTLLYGKSGIGKSSILNAGIIPTARRYGYLPVLVRFSHKEGQKYLSQIKDSIANAMIPIPLDETGTQIALTIEEQRQREFLLKRQILKVVNCKNAEKESLYEFFHRHTFHNAEGERIKLLIIFDQFEEIFTLQNEELPKKRFFAELADFLNDVMPTDLQNEVLITEPQKKKTVIGAGNFGNLFNDLKLGANSNLPEYVTDNDIHLVFTIREDFLSEFEYYSASIPSLKQNRYGLRPINEEQAAQIILRPMPGLINEDVAKLIIEKVTGRTDFKLDGIPEIEVDSAVLSLYLNRLYDAKISENITSELVEQKGGEIIADFYKDAISSISEPVIEYLEDMLLNGQGRRDNITVFDAINDGGATEEELDILCNKKKILRQFNYAGDLRIEYVHDILCPVVKAHKDERLLEKQQEEERVRQEEEKQRLLLEEKEKRERIEREAEEEKARLKAETIRIRKRNRSRLNAIGLVLLISIVGATVYWLLYEKEYTADYATYTTQNGWPIGIGHELSDADKKQMPLYYQLVRKGYKGKNTLVKVMNSHHKPAENKFDESPLVSLSEIEGTDEKAKEFALLQSKTARWVYTPDNEGQLLRKTAYGLDDKELLYAVQYFRSTDVSVKEDAEDSQNKQLWANYVDKDGKALRIRDNGADRVRIIVDESTGFYKGFLFFNETGTPQQNSQGAFGYRYEIDQEKGYQTAIIPLDEYGDSIPGQSLYFDKVDKYGRWLTAGHAFAEYAADHVIYDMGDRIDSMCYDADGHQTYRSETIKKQWWKTYRYDSKGHLTDKSAFKISSHGDMELYSKFTYVYDDDSEELKEKTRYLADASVKYKREVHEIQDATHTFRYFSGSSLSDLKPSNTKDDKYCKITETEQYTDSTKTVTKMFFAIDSISGKEKQLQREEYTYDNNNILMRKIVYVEGWRSQSIEYEIENGVIVGQHVIGLTGDIIRCPQWDDDGLTYYRKRFVRNFMGDIVATKAINEFGEESMVTFGDKEIRISVVPGNEIMEEGEAYTTYGIGIFKYSASPVDKSLKVDYLHIIDTLGTYYQCGLRDGDIILNTDGNKIQIARPLGNNNKEQYFDIQFFTPKKGDSGIDIYPVYYTKSEMRRLQESIKSKNRIK